MVNESSNESSFDQREGEAQQRKISDDELAMLNYADPHALTSTKPWEFEARSVFLKRVSWAFVVVNMALCIWIGLTLGDKWTGASISTVDKFAFPGVGLIVSILVYIALNRPRVRANRDGVEVRNIIGTRFYPWVVIYGLAFPEGSRMARLELPDFEFVPLWAMQSADGAATIEAVKRFRKLEDVYMPED